MTDEAWGALIEDALKRALPDRENAAAVLSDAMRWAVEGGGKRVRPRICLAAAVAVGGRAEEALWPACAVELLHTYTLVHDDLPSMDGDELRRGKASVWKRFGEAAAVLAGDALQAQAFAVLANTPEKRPGVCRDLLAELGEKARGVVCGQIAEMTAPDRAAAVDYVYTHKTADLFVAAARMGAIAGGGTPEQVARLGRFALELGLAFQHEDDLIDGDSPLGTEEAARRVRLHTKAACDALDGLPGETDALRALAARLMTRTV